MSNSKGLSTILLIVVIVAVGIIGAGAGYYYGANNVATTTQLVTAVKTPTPKVTTSAVGATTTAVDTADWKTYTNDQYGFSFKYPTTMTVGGAAKNSVLGTAQQPVGGIYVGPLVFVIADTQNLKKIAGNYLNQYMNTTGEKASLCKEEKVANQLANITYLSCNGDGGKALYALIKGSKVDVFVDGYSGGFDQNNLPREIDDSEVAQILSTFQFTK